MIIGKGEIHPFFFGADMGSTLSVGTITTLESTYFPSISHCGVTNKSFVTLNVKVRTVCGLQFLSNVKHYVGLEADEINQLRFEYSARDVFHSVKRLVSGDNNLVGVRLKQKLKSFVMCMDLFGFDEKIDDNWLRTACDLLREVQALSVINEPITRELGNLIYEH